MIAGLPGRNGRKAWPTMDGNCVEESFSSMAERRHFDDDDAGSTPVMIPKETNA